VELGRRASDPEAKLKRITAWLDARPDVGSFKTGEEFDLWHGNFDDVEQGIEQNESTAFVACAPKP